MADDFDIARIDEVIHGRIRLGIMAYLAGAERADFNTLKARLQTTDGNLSVHLRKLEDAGFVTVTTTCSPSTSSMRCSSCSMAPMFCAISVHRLLQ